MNIDYSQDIRNIENDYHKMRACDTCLQRNDSYVCYKCKSIPTIHYKKIVDEKFYEKSSYLAQLLLHSEIPAQITMLFNNLHSNLIIEHTYNNERICDDLYIYLLRKGKLKALQILKEKKTNKNLINKEMNNNLTINEKKTVFIIQKNIREYMKYVSELETNKNYRFENITYCYKSVNMSYECALLIANQKINEKIIREFPLLLTISSQ